LKAYFEGQIGLSQKFSVVAPKPLPVGTFSSKIIVSATCGVNHTIFLSRDGSVFVCGNNEKGVLGLPPSKHQKLVELNKSLFNEKAIISAACGKEHTLFLTDDHQVWGCGISLYGQLGFRQHDDQPNKIHRITNSSFDSKKVIKIWCAEYTSFILTENGRFYELWICGQNRNCLAGTVNLFQPTLLLNGDQLLAPQSSIRHNEVLCVAASHFSDEGIQDRYYYHTVVLLGK